MAIQIRYAKSSELCEPVRVNLNSWPNGVFTLIIGLICKFQAFLFQLYAFLRVVCVNFSESTFVLIDTLVTCVTIFPQCRMLYCYSVCQCYFEQALQFDMDLECKIEAYPPPAIRCPICKSIAKIVRSSRSGGEGGVLEYPNLLETLALPLVLGWETGMSGYFLNTPSLNWSQSPVTNNHISQVVPGGLD